MGPDGSAAREVAAAYALLERLRWGGAPSTCPHCGTGGRCAYVRPRDGVTRRTRTGGPSARRVWRCRACRRQFSALTGTVLHGTRIDVRTWVAVLADAADERRIPDVTTLRTRHGVSREVAVQVIDLLAAACTDPTVRQALRDSD